LPAAPAIAAPAEPPGRSRVLEIDGLRLHVLDYASDAGRGARPPLLLLHGGMAHARWWDLVGPLLADVAHPLALDRRGHGDSDWADPERYGWERDLLDVEEAMRRLSAEPWIVVGHSQGGLQAVSLATRGNVALRALVLVDVPLDPTGARLQRAGRAFQRMPQLAYPSLEHAVRRFQPFPSPHRIAEPVLDYLARHSFKRLADGTYTSKFHWKSYQRDRSREGKPLADHGARLRRIGVPVLSVHAAASPVLSAAEQAELVRRLPRGQGVEIADATHSVHAERPDEVARAVREFVALV
jgi:pimeloyl-ACP methyl ester carboxylesterase